jgi:hypothetical protein
MRILVIILLIISINFKIAFAEGGQKVLTREDVITKLSASEFIKKRISELFNWGIGYDLSRINRTNLAPVISFIKAAPIRVPPDNRTLFLLTAKVSDPGGMDNIRGVRADLGEINKLPNTMLVDNGLWGDIRSGDGIYTLQTSVGNDVPNGTKDIAVAVSNKMGWVALGRTNMNVETNPVISDIKVDPQTIRSGNKAVFLITAKVVNPGRQEDMRDVSIDLSSLGMGNNEKMWDNNTHGDRKTGDKTYSLKVYLKSGLSAGTKKLTIKASNALGGSTENDVFLMVE